MNDKKKILIVHNYYQVPGGEDTVVANEKKMLENQGHEVILYSRNNNEIKTLSMLKKIILPLITIFNPKTYRDVKKIINVENVDIVHVHNTLSLISPSVYYAAFSCGIPVVQTIHNFRLLCPAATFYRDGCICEECVERGLSCAVRHNCYRGSKLQTILCVINTKIHRILRTYSKLNYICLTEFNKEKLLQLNSLSKNNIINENKVFIKPNFTYRNLEKQKHAEYYLFIGRIEEIKGLSLLIEAFEKMPEKKLYVVGTGADYEKYVTEVKQRLISNIIFTGFLERDGINRLLSGAKAVIVSSQWYETFGMIIAESFASHVPVITGDIGNIGGLVIDGVTGTKFQYDSAEELKKAIQRFETMPYNELKENAFKEYDLKFSSEVNYKQIIAIYNQVSKQEN